MNDNINNSITVIQYKVMENCLPIDNPDAN